MAAGKNKDKEMQAKLDEAVELLRINHERLERIEKDIALILTNQNVLTDNQKILYDQITHKFL